LASNPSAVLLDGVDEHAAGNAIPGTPSLEDRRFNRAQVGLVDRLPSRSGISPRISVNARLRLAVGSISTGSSAIIAVKPTRRLPRASDV
jgi:hypothetical protein